MAPIQQTIDERLSKQGVRPGNPARYNLMGTIATSEGPTMTPKREGIIIGSVDMWVETLLDYYHRLRMDTFTFWPITQNVEAQARLFAEQVVPAVREGAARLVRS
jgi:hypothetical protein